MHAAKILFVVALAVAAVMAEDAERPKKQIYSGYYGSGYGAYPYSAGYSAGAYPYSAGAYPYSAGAYSYSAGAYPYSAGYSAYPYSAYSAYPSARAYY